MLISMATNTMAAQGHQGVHCVTHLTRPYEGEKYHVLTSSWGSHKCVTPSGWDYHILVSPVPDLFPKRDAKGHVTPSPWHTSQHFGVISTKASIDPLLTRCKDLARLTARGWWRQWRSTGGQWWQKICRTAKWSFHGQCAGYCRTSLSGSHLSVVHICS